MVCEAILHKILNMKKPIHIYSQISHKRIKDKQNDPKTLFSILDVRTALIHVPQDIKQHPSKHLDVLFIFICWGTIVW